MRGLAMLIVVFWHVHQHFLIESDSHLKIFLTSFAVPLFYFISGYLGFRIFKDLSFKANLKRITAKFKALVVPSIFFILIKCAYRNELFITTNYGFILSLFFMFLVLYICTNITNSKIFDVTYIVVTLGLFFFRFVDMKFHIMPDSPIFEMFKYGLTFLPYFVLGNFSKKHNKIFDGLLSNDKIITLLLMFYGGSFFLLHIFSNDGFPGDGMLLGISGTLIAFKFFQHYKALFTTENRIGVFLQHIGSKTMDIFCLHWFFLTLMPEISEVLNKYHLQQFEFVFVALYAILIVLLCLGLSKIICLSHILEKYLFGRNTISYK